MGTEIDRLEIEVEAQAQKANRQLDGLSKKLDKVAGSLEKMDTGGLGDFAKNLGMFKKAIGGVKDLKTSDFTKLARNIEKLASVDGGKLQRVGSALKYLSVAIKDLDGKNISIKINDGDFKKMEQTGKKVSLTADELAEKFKDVGKIDLSNSGLEDLESIRKSAAELDKQLDRLFSKEEKILATSDGSPSGKAWENLQYDINAATNKLEIYRAKIAELEALSRRQMDDVPVFRGEVSSTSGDDLPQQTKINSDAMKYNAEAMRAVFGEAAEGIHSWSDAVDQFGSRARDVLNDFDSIPVKLDLGTYEGQIKQLKADLAEMRIGGLGAGNEDYDEKYLELEKVVQKQKEYKKYMSELAKLSNVSAKAISGEGRNAGLAADEMQELARKKAGASTSNKELEKAAGKTATGLKKEGSSAKSASKAFKNLSAFAKKTSGKISGMFGRISKGFSGMNNQTKNAGNNLGKQMSGFFSLSRMVGMSVLYSTVFRMITAINQGFVTGMQNLAQYSDQTNKSLSSLMSAMTQLKNSFATAFAPILDVVAPYLVTFINLISKAVTYVGMFFAALSGKSSFIKAIPVTEDYAASIAKSSDSAGDLADNTDKATDSAKELKKTVMAFDQIHALTDNSADNTNKGKSDDSDDMGGYVPPSPSEMFEEVPIDSKMLEWAEKFKNQLDKLRKSAEPTTAALKKLYNQGLKKLGNFSIRTLKDLWNNYLKPMGKWMLADNSGFPRFFNITNDLLNEINWNRLNGALADFFTMLQKPTKFSWNVLMDFYEYFMKPMAVWTMSSAVPQLVDALTEFGNKVHWDEINDSLKNFWQAMAPFTQNVGQGIVDFYKDLLGVGAEFINTYVPDGFNKLAKSISNINPETAKAIGYALGELFTALAAFKTLEWIGTIFGSSGAIGKGFALLAAHPFLTISGGILGVAGALDKFGYINVDWDWLWESVGKVKDVFTAFVDNVNWTKLVESFANFAAAFTPALISGMDFMFNDIGAPLINAAGDAFGWLAEKLNDMSPEQLEALGKSIAGIATAITAVKVGKPLLDGLAALYSGFKNIKNVLGGGKGGKTLAESINETGEAAGGATGKVESVGGAAQTATGMFGAFWGNIFNATASAYFIDQMGKVKDIFNGTREETIKTDAAFQVIKDALIELYKDGKLGADGLAALNEPMFHLYNDEAPAFNSAFDTIQQKLEDTGISSSEFKTALETSLGESKGVAEEYSTAMNSYIKGVDFNGLATNAQTGIDNTNSTIRSGADSVKSSLKYTFLDSIDLSDELKKKYSGYAAFSVQGYNDKIKELEGDTKTTMRSFAENGVKFPFANKLGIHSPSTVFAGFGTNVVDGLRNGIDDRAGTARDSVQRLGDDLKSSMDSSLGDIERNTDNTIRTLDTSFSSAETSASNSANNIVNAFSNLRIPLPHIDVWWDEWSIGDTSFSIPRFGVNWYAKGGIFDKKSIIGVGEDGKEAVMPLEKNTGWIDTLSQKIYRNMSDMKGMKLNTGAAFMAKEAEINSKFNSTKEKSMGISDLVGAVRDEFKEVVADVMMEVMMGANNQNQTPKEVIVDFTYNVDSETHYKTTLKGKKKYEGRFFATAKN